MTPAPDRPDGVDPGVILALSSIVAYVGLILALRACAGG